MTVPKVTLHYLMLYRFEIHSALELSRTALLCCRLAVVRKIGRQISNQTVYIVWLFIGKLYNNYYRHQ